MDKIISALQRLIDDLANQRIIDIIARNENGVLTENEIVDAISEYGGAISAETVDTHRLNLIEYQARPEAGMLEYELRVDNRPSDLTLTCEYDLARSPVLTIESLHVL